MQTLWLDPAIARGVLRHLARHQAETTDEAADAEPGKILHEMRQGEMALLGEVPFRHYYGSVDSTPLFVMLAGAYLERTDDLETVRRLWPNIQAALRWMDESGDRDGDGFIEYGRKRDTGLINQGWKDSHDSIFHADGTLAHGPIALVEVQAYAFGAWRAAASIARRLGDDDAADGYAERASRLQQRFDDAFFDKALGTYVLALDGDKRPCRVRASNAGHALFSGIARPERAAAVVKTLTSNAFFSGWGVRTVAVGEARYNPMSYHNGSVWPHDNALIARGLRALRLPARGGAPVRRAVRGLGLHRSAPPARAVLRLPARARPWADLLSRRLLAAGLGGGDALVAAAVLPRPALRHGARLGGVRRAVAAGFPR